MIERVYSKEKAIKILEDVRRELQEHKEELQRAFDLDFRSYKYKTDFDKILNCIDLVEEKEFLPKINKNEIVDGIGKLALIVKNQNPYQIFKFILNAIITNNEVEVFLTDKLLATNRTIVETIRGVCNVNFIQIHDYYDFVNYQKCFDKVFYYGIKEEYFNFIKRIHVDSHFECFGNLNVFSDSESFKNRLLEIDRLAYNEEFEVDYFKGDLDESLKQMNSTNDTTKISLIYTMDIEKAYEFIKQVKSRKVYINQEISKIDFYEIDERKLVYYKQIKLK